MKDLNVSIHQHSDHYHIALSGKLESIEAIKFKTRIKDLAANGKSIVLDLSSVTGISLTGLNSIMIASMILKRKGKRLVIKNISNQLSDLIHMTKMSDAFEYESWNLLMKAA